MAKFMDLPNETRLQIMEATVADDFENLALTCKANYALVMERHVKTHAWNRARLSSVTLDINWGLSSPIIALTDHLETLLIMDAFLSPYNSYYFETPFFETDDRYYVRSLALCMPQLHYSSDSMLSYYNFMTFLQRFQALTKIPIAGAIPLTEVSLTTEGFKWFFRETLFRVFPNLTTLLFTPESQDLCGWQYCERAPYIDNTLNTTTLSSLKRLILKPAPCTPRFGGPMSADLLFEKLVWVLELPCLEYMYLGGLCNGHPGCLRRCFHPQTALREAQLDFQEAADTRTVAMFLSQMVGLEKFWLTSEYRSVRKSLKKYGRDIEYLTERYRKQTLEWMAERAEYDRERW